MSPYLSLSHCEKILLDLYIWEDKSSEYYIIHLETKKFIEEWYNKNEKFKEKVEYYIKESNMNLLGFAGFFTPQQLILNPVLVNKCTHEAILGKEHIIKYLEFVASYLKNNII